MKNKIRTLITATIALGLSAGQVHANDEGLAALGGFVAGIITGAIIEDHHGYHHDAGVRISVGDRHDRYGSYSRHGQRGYWEVRHVRVWIPGRWEFVRNECGQSVRVWRPGHHRMQRTRVWVADRGRSHRGSYCR